MKNSDSSLWCTLSLQAFVLQLVSESDSVIKKKCHYTRPPHDRYVLYLTRLSKNSLCRLFIAQMKDVLICERKQFAQHLDRASSSFATQEGTSPNRRFYFKQGCTSAKHWRQSELGEPLVKCGQGRQIIAEWWNHGWGNGRGVGAERVWGFGRRGGG